MFRDVPECSGMFHAPGFIDDLLDMQKNLYLDFRSAIHKEKEKTVRRSEGAL